MQKATKQNNYLYNPKLKERARYLRNNGTKAEAYLWKFCLKNSITAHQFYRQRPVGNFIADFMCPELMLIIEADGATHLMEGAEMKDAKRQKTIENMGFQVLRFEDGMVLNNLSMTMDIIEQEIEKIRSKIISEDSPL